jgi:hypothetical protein
VDTSKVYKDANGDDCTIFQMLQREPYWAASRLQAGEIAIAELADRTSEVLVADCTALACSPSIKRAWDRLTAACSEKDAELDRLRGVWIDGEPPSPYGDEWFIALTIHGDRVVLRALPKDYTYDYRTADETYMKRENIKKWMQFPDTEYVSHAEAANAKLREEVGKLQQQVEFFTLCSVETVPLYAAEDKARTATLRAERLEKALEKVREVREEVCFEPPTNTRTMHILGLEGGPMTTTEFEKIALWMGWRKGLNPDFWVSFDGAQSHGVVHLKTSLTDAEAVEALNRLAEKGYLISLSGCNGAFSIAVAQHRRASMVTKIVDGETYYPTIAAAVEQAILQMIAAEGNNG